MFGRWRGIGVMECGVVVGGEEWGVDDETGEKVIPTPGTEIGGAFPDQPGGPPASFKRAQSSTLCSPVTRR